MLLDSWVMVEPTRINIRLFQWTLVPLEQPLQFRLEFGQLAQSLDNGDLKCWGSDYYGQLGDGGSTNSRNLNAPSSTPVNLGNGRTAVAVSTSGYHTCAILDNGDVKCWGRDKNGELGDGGAIISTDYTTEPSATPINLGYGSNGRCDFRFLR